MARNIIQLAGGSFENLKNLSGPARLRDREVVIAKDTNELYVGKEDGSFKLLGNVHLGMDSSEVDPQRGRFFFNELTGTLLVANGVGWRKIVPETLLRVGDGLRLNAETGLVEVDVDDQSIVINENGKIAVKNTDYGSF